VRLASIPGSSYVSRYESYKPDIYSILTLDFSTNSHERYLHTFCARQYEIFRPPIKHFKETSWSVIMEGLAFEFVTITNPDEIKDPTKQKAIRRKARRRANESQSIARKPFKVVIDLPVAGGIETGLEPQIRQPDYVPPAEHEFSVPEAGNPPIYSLSPISTDARPVSLSPLSPEMKAEVMNIGKIG
jgi:hypothetical protein